MQVSETGITYSVNTVKKYGNAAKSRLSAEQPALIIKKI
ncbi:hypothetical protein FHW36_10314 [Chitinophaga polysaccharea]|uniref:Uncharacterized protein n=1 Tax=Chitinophaga polysaccharea TaxID=1293035 RepID=A0A561PSW5_9BACT|nr:hypothetical protein FHW36_10314 [Chitinophaga polysaccharea]